MSLRKFKIPLFLTSLSIGFLSFMLTVYAKELDMSAVQISLLFSIFSLINLILRPIVGVLIDRYGRRNLFALACIFYSLAMFSYAVSDTTMLLYMSRMIQAIGASFLVIATSTISIDLSNTENRGRIIGIFQASSNKGMLYGTLLGFTILSYFPLMVGWNYLFMVYGTLSLAAAVFILLKVPETKKMTDDQVKVKIKLNRFIIILLLITLLRAVGTSLISPIFIIYLQDQMTATISTIAAAFIPASLIYSYLPMKAGKQIDKKKKKTYLLMGCSISIFIPILITLTTKIDYLIILWVLEAIGVVFASVALQSIIGDAVGINSIGKQYGIFMFVTSIGTIIGPLIGGYTYDYIHVVSPFFIYSGLMLISLLIILLYIPQDAKKVN